MNNRTVTNRTKTRMSYPRCMLGYNVFEVTILKGFPDSTISLIFFLVSSGFLCKCITALRVHGEYLAWQHFLKYTYVRTISAITCKRQEKSIVLYSLKSCMDFFCLKVDLGLTFSDSPKTCLKSTKVTGSPWNFWNDHYKSQFFLTTLSIMLLYTLLIYHHADIFIITKHCH